MNIEFYGIAPRVGHRAFRPTRCGRKTDAALGQCGSYAVGKKMATAMAGSCVRRSSAARERSVKWRPSGRDDTPDRSRRKRKFGPDRAKRRHASFWSTALEVSAPGPISLPDGAIATLVCDSLTERVEAVRMMKSKRR